MQTLDEMLSRKLLTTNQHAEISAWVTRTKTPGAILQMPDRLWRSLELASVLMNVDADLIQPPLLSLGGYLWARTGGYAPSRHPATTFSMPYCQVGGGRFRRAANLLMAFEVASKAELAASAATYAPSPITSFTRDAVATA